MAELTKSEELKIVEMANRALKDRIKLLEEESSRQRQTIRRLTETCYDEGDDCDIGCGNL
jgi:hypothetical protein